MSTLPKHHTTDGINSGNESDDCILQRKGSTLIMLEKIKYHFILKHCSLITNQS